MFPESSECAHEAEECVQGAASVFMKQRGVSDRAKAWTINPQGVLLYGPPGCSKTLLAKVPPFERHQLPYKTV